MTLYAFQITGTAQAESLDDALRAIAAYTDPDNEDAEPTDDRDDPIQAIAYRWREVAADYFGGTYDSDDVRRLLDDRDN